MKAILVIMLCVMTLHAEARSSKSDEINKYIVDGKAVSSFDGSQLKGKIIADYSVKTEKQGKEVVNTHVITTIAPADIKGIGSGPMTDNFTSEALTISDLSGIKIRKSGDMSKVMIPDKNIDKVVFVVDGEKTDNKRLPENVESIEIKKGDPEMIKKYGEDAQYGVVFITTKGGAKYNQTLYFLDDEPITETEFKSLVPKDIDAIEIIKDNGVEPFLRGKEMKADNVGTIVLVTTKKRKIRYF
ncbi:MAG: hypothetical protein J6Y82_03000 [Bacteroidales bacterium]|nr:hypothetical protein [Bacteroidales bacterium]